MQKLLVITTDLDDPANNNLSRELVGHGYETVLAKGPRKIQEHLDASPGGAMIWRLDGRNFELAKDIAFLLNIARPHKLVVSRESSFIADDIESQLTVPFRTILNIAHADHVLSVLQGESYAAPGKDDGQNNPAEIDFDHMFRRNREVRGGFDDPLPDNERGFQDSSTALSEGEYEKLRSLDSPSGSKGAGNRPQGAIFSILKRILGGSP